MKELNWKILSSDPEGPMDLRVNPVNPVREKSPARAGLSSKVFR